VSLIDCCRLPVVVNRGKVKSEIHASNLEEMNKMQHKESIWVVSATLFLSALTFTTQVFAEASLSKNRTDYADRVFINGEVITLNDRQPKAHALAVKDGKILYVGDAEGIKAFMGSSTEQVDLLGKTLTPGFVDAHSHFAFAALMADWVNVSIPPVGPVSSIDDIIATLNAHVEKHPLSPGQPLMAYGYDANGLKDGRDITRDDIDAHFPDNPVILVHVSGHGAVLNSPALSMAGISAATPTPAGGVIARKPGSQEPAGLLMETAWIPLLTSLPRPSYNERLVSFEKAQNLYAANGYTTIQDGASKYLDVVAYKKAASEGHFFLDLVTLPVYMDMQQFFGDEVMDFGRYHNRIKLGGVKIVTDGSPQGRTAYFSHAMHGPGPDGQSTWFGEPTMPYEEYQQIFKAAEHAGLRIYTHANGDAAVDMVLKAHAATGVFAEQDRRNIVIHSQFMRPEQLDSYQQYGISPSFFSNHAFYWGDVHTENLGEERAHFLSPMKSAAEKGIIFSNHTDFNVTPLDPMMTIWTAVARESRSGKIIGKDQRISAYEALKALTIYPAWQYKEENTKGTLEVGKLADLVILSANPLIVDTPAIRDITIEATYKEGQAVFVK